MIKNHKLIIDESCPMCKLYGKCFVNTKLIDQETIHYYQTVNSSIFDQIDQERAKSEVAFVDTKSGKVIYGAAAFLTILSHKSPVLKWLFKQRLVYYFIVHLYRLISFNRHLIVSTQRGIVGRDCTPQHNLLYRWIYLILGALFTGFVVNQFTFQLYQQLGWEHTYWQEYFVCFGQIGWQFLVLYFINKKQRMNYLGNMTTVSVIGALLLLPILLLNKYLIFSSITLLAGFGLIVAFMLLIHLKRSAHLGLPIWTSVSWVFYRTIVLFIILFQYTQL